MPVQIRAAVLTNYVAVAQAAGLDPWQMVLEAGLTRACLDDPELRIPIDRVTDLLEESASRSGLEAFGLLMVEERRITNLGVLGLLAREEPNLRAALLSASRYARVHNEALSQRIEEANGIAIVYEDLLTQRQRHSRQGMEMVLGVLVRLIKVLLGAQWRARRICFSHPEPASLGVHRRVLGQTPEFGCDFDGIVCTSQDLDTPIASADPVVSEYLRQKLHLDEVASATTAQEVRQMILLLMPRGRCTAEQIAQLMGVNRRTLYRHLSAEGHSYPALLQSIRSELVPRYLAEKRRSLADVAHLLGFGEQSSFSRWYRGTFGRTAEADRRRENH